jgi:6-phosphogluconolactonase
MKLHIFPDVESLNNFAARIFVEIYDNAIEDNRAMTVALSGGSTPKSLYQLLASEKFKDRFKNRIDWNNFYFFFGDERNVLPDDPESNFRMASENLFQPLKIPADQIYQWDTTLKDSEKIAESYHQVLTYFFGLDEEEKFPRFDLVFLGMGADGHTASLFPFTEALRETEKIAVANYVEKLDTTRLTLTFPVFNNADVVVFLVAGKEKAETLKNVLEGEFEPEKFPSQNVKPEHHNLFWLVDEAAASLLRHK